MNEEMVHLTIDGIPVTAPKGTLVIEAARQMGVMIPHFCYHPKLKWDANCRMCLVEIEKTPKLQTSCSTPVAEGMVVRTATPVVTQAHKSVLEFILANHPLDCPVCDQGGRCDLQDFSHEYTPTTSRFIEVKRVFQKEYFSPLIETQMNRCVQCLRCVRYCDEVMDVKALAPAGRGTMTEIKHFTTHELDCEFCGGCVQICPVGAFTSRLSMYEFRPWMLKRADTICTYCGDGCQIMIQTKENDLIEVMSAHGAGRNNGDLCARGFFGYHVSTHPDRLQHPLIRRDGKLVQATWEEALELIAETCIRLKLTHGAEAFAGLIASRCTNEDLYVFQKFMRLVIGSNKIDSSARYGHINGVRALRRVQGSHRWTVTFEDIVAADALLLVGTNITETNPTTGLMGKEAARNRGARVLTIETMARAARWSSARATSRHSGRTRRAADPREHRHPDESPGSVAADRAARPTGMRVGSPRRGEQRPGSGGDGGGGGVSAGAFRPERPDRSRAPCRLLEGRAAERTGQDADGNSRGGTGRHRESHVHRRGKPRELATAGGRGQRGFGTAGVARLSGTVSD